MTLEGKIEDQVKNLEDKESKTENLEVKDALEQAIAQLKVGEKEEKPAHEWGIFTYFFVDGKCDYMKSTTLAQGQQFYRNRSKGDVATIFVAEGEVTRQKGDQVAIECCTGKALMDGNLKLKTYESDQIYVVNHESGTIYNDITKYMDTRMSEAEK